MDPFIVELFPKRGIYDANGNLTLRNGLLGVLFAGGRRGLYLVRDGVVALDFSKHIFKSPKTADFFNRN